MKNKKKILIKKPDYENLVRLYILNSIYNLDDNKINKKYKLNKHSIIISSRKWKRRRIEKETKKIMEEML